MSATNHTKTLGLSQYIGSDKPTYLGDYNADMEKIDTAIGDLVTTTSSVSQNMVPVLMQNVEDLQKATAKNAGDIAVNTSSIGALKQKDIALDNDIKTLDAREQAHYDALSGNVDTSADAIKQLQDQQTVFQANLQVTRNIAAVNSSSINKLQGRVTILENNQTNSDIKIDTLETDVDNLKTETDTLDTTMRQYDTSIKKLTQDVLTNTASIARNSYRITSLEVLPSQVSDLQTKQNDMQQDIDSNMGDITALQGDVTNLQTKTAGITDGVTVPFGFGTTSDNKKGYEDGGVVKPFTDPSILDSINHDIAEINQKIQALNTKTAGIADGKKLPFSLGIESAGGAYGYIKNGETGVTPFLTENDVESIVNITPIQAKVANIQGSPTLVKGARIVANQVGTADLGLFKEEEGTVVENNGVTIYGDSHLDVHHTIGFGVDSYGNYGYIKAGADTVTPFLTSYSGSVDAPNTSITPDASKYKVAMIQAPNNFIVLDLFNVASSNVLTLVKKDGTQQNSLAVADTSKLDKLPKLICRFFSTKKAYTFNAGNYIGIIAPNNVLIHSLAFYYNTVVVI